ncbi:cation-binding hemerythrin HHE family protein [Thiorhodovibrio winogradskyi]|uniref:Cation-binding hemerythrin HHE family protein n=1 Tax=Thiorhodovibrio winogradskyi TaxID=77007 RepID=A0ABZ0SDT0_9GAMM|nr:hemerythrin family protein [Thiorhodovibrio winogradskyi]
MHQDVSRRVNALQGLAFHSLKPLLEWHKDFGVDEPTIDAQHEAIFELALKASELAQERSDDELLFRVFERFGRALEAHFRFEEDKLGEINYPDIDNHRAQHQAMLAEFDFVRQRIRGNQSEWAFQHQSLIMLNFMIGVTVGHILSADVDYAQFIHRPAEAA